jgi:uncharacterized protein (DUF305 family)
MKTKYFFAAAIAIAVPLLAFAQGMPAMPGMNMPAAENPADAAYMAAHDTMMANMHVDLTGNPDRDFVLLMIPHHQGAIDMARVLLEHGTDPELRAMAQAIIDAQEGEIAAFQAWLAAHP